MGRKKIAIDEKEQLFCRYFVESASPRESAARAGYTFPERSALRLLETGRIKEEILRLFRESEKNSVRSLVVSGLKRLAFGSVADAVSLILREDEPSAQELETLDLFCISEIKRPKTGGMEIKFFSRLEALERLLELSNEQEAQASGSFFEALTRGAAALQTGSMQPGGEDEVL